jgi:alginate O-acetyltransferase complex protein AlgJ
MLRRGWSLARPDCILVSMPKTRLRARADAICVGLFLAALLAPWVDALARPAAARGPEREGRAAAPMPGWPASLEEVETWPTRLRARFDDVFGLRDVLLRWNSLEKLYVFGVSPTDRAYVGRDGWMFYSRSRSIDSLRGLVPWTAEDLGAAVKRFVERRDALRARNIEYLLVVVPNKESVYPEKVPARFERVAPTRLDGLTAAFEAAHFDAFVDLRAALLAAKSASDGPLYCPLGSHWEHRGALAAYHAIAARLGARSLRSSPLDERELTLVAAPALYDSWARRMYVEDVLAGEAFEYVPTAPRAHVLRERARHGPGTTFVTAIEGSTHPRALFVHDSFGPYLERLLAEHFASLTCAWTNAYDDALVTASQPDIVIELFVERRLVTFGAAGAAAPQDQ